MREPLIYAVVFTGGGLGAALRHACNRIGLAVVGPGFPAGTLFVNIAGCALMGAFVGWFALRGETASPSWRLFLTTGLCGGFTTFSAFSLDAWTMWQRGDHLLSGAYVAFSVVLSLLALLLGIAVSRAVLA